VRDRLLPLRMNTFFVASTLHGYEIYRVRCFPE